VITFIGLTTYIALLLFGMSGATLVKPKEVSEPRDYKHWGEG
jgi:hypothetical protein